MVDRCARATQSAAENTGKLVLAVP